MSQLLTSPCTVSTETPPPGYISEDGEASDQQMNQSSMDTGTVEFFLPNQVKVKSTSRLTGLTRLMSVALGFSPLFPPHAGLYFV